MCILLINYESLYIIGRESLTAYFLNTSGYFKVLDVKTDIANNLLNRNVKNGCWDFGLILTQISWQLLLTSDIVITDSEIVFSVFPCVVTALVAIPESSQADGEGSACISDVYILQYIPVYT
jgi:hypothetical protein